jgi:hypothetical protein
MPIRPPPSLRCPMRLLQQITLTLLEAGQKAVDPPWKATSEAIQGGVNSFAGGITWVDPEYDERLGAALEPLMDGNRRPELGRCAGREDREDDIGGVLPQRHQSARGAQGDKMTAYETQQRVRNTSAGRCLCSSRWKSNTTAGCASRPGMCRWTSACSARSRTCRTYAE